MAGAQGVHMKSIDRFVYSSAIPRVVFGAM